MSLPSNLFFNKQPYYKYIPISKLSKFDFCPKAAKIELFIKPKYSGNLSQNNSMKIGIKMHTKYSTPYKEFERRKLLSLLKYRYGRVLQRVFGEYAIRGILDDLLVSVENKVLYVSLIELKTTHKHKLIAAEIKAFIFQLQLYIWIIEPILRVLGYALSKQHYLEIYSQVTGKLIKRIIVESLANMEEKLNRIFLSFQGLEPMTIPPMYVCKHCSKPVKNSCSWYKERNKQ